MNKKRYEGIKGKIFFKNEEIEKILDEIFKFKQEHQQV